MSEFRTNLRIEEVEGDKRWIGQLFGRALPTLDSPPQWGVDSMQEDTYYRGTAAGRTEPLHLTYPDLAFQGTWKANHFITGDARVLIYPPSFDNPRTPQVVCNFFEDFAARQKVCDVTWSGGVLRRVRWVSFRWGPGRGPDRTWTMTFRVLARATTAAVVQDDPIDKRTMMAGLRKAARDLDLALATAMLGIDKGFLSNVKKILGNVRAKSAALRKEIDAAGDLARLPTDTLRQVDITVQDFRATVQEARDQYDQTAWEYQTAQQNSITLRAARQMKTNIWSAADAQLELVLLLATFIQRQKVNPIRYVACKAGDSLVRIALREMGAGDLWTQLADSNGIVGQIVPAGVSRLVIPEAA